MAGLFQVLWGQSDGTFKKAATLNGTDGKPLIIPVEGGNWIENICTRPFAVDWDGDGHLDLVVGNFAGTFYLFKGQGKGKFLPKPEQIKAGDAAAENRGSSQRSLRGRLGRRRRPRPAERLKRGGRAMGRESRRAREAASIGTVSTADQTRSAGRIRVRSCTTRTSRRLRAARESGSTTSIPTASSTFSSAIR